MYIQSHYFDFNNMKKILKIAAIVLFSIFVIVQLIRPERINPSIVDAEILESSIEVPEKVSQILARSCNDCHTNNTRYPWYSNVTPFNWFLVRHIEEGRRELNFSKWNTYDKSRQRRKLGDICEQITDRQMPLPSYLWIHSEARLSAEDVKVLCDWTDVEIKRLAENQ